MSTTQIRNQAGKQPVPTYMDCFPAQYREFAWEVLQAMTAASQEDRRREHAQITKVYSAIQDDQPVKVWAFWCAEAKEFARRWEELRSTQIQQVAPLNEPEPHPEPEPVAELDAEAEQHPAPAEDAPEPGRRSPRGEGPKRPYRTFEYQEGVNPFREGSKNAAIFEMLREGNANGQTYTKAELAEKTGADIKSVGYCLWLLRRNGWGSTAKATTTPRQG